VRVLVAAMARHSQDREDLLRDATALVDRVQIEVMLEGHSTELFAGFRAQGAASLYFDQDPVYHFNGRGELRRAFIAGELLKAEAGNLIAWTRQPSAQAVNLLRRRLAPEMQQQLLLALAQRMTELGQRLAAGEYDLQGQVAADRAEPPLERLAHFLDSCPEMTIARTPRVGD
jgi:hypothetical protein